MGNTQKIFVNRSLNMGSIKSIGFDMDHTLAQYKREAFEALAFKETLKKFIKAGYPQELSELVFDPDFVIRGLLVDRDRGNLLQVDGHKYVKKAFHGKKPLDKDERHRLYNSESIKAEEFLSIDTFFALSEVQLFIEIVDYMRCHPGKIEKTFSEVYADLRKFIDLSHADGSIKNTVLSNLETYFVKDKNKEKALARLKEVGKSLFLLTNSQWNYTEKVMSYLFAGENGNWMDYFDYIIVGAKKPAFFTGSDEFSLVDKKTLELESYKGPLSSEHIYHGGNAHLFQKLTDQKGDEILYCGDHIYGDIIRSKEEYNWRTLVIVEELSEHFGSPSMENHWEEIAQTFQLREDLDEEVQKIRSLIRISKKQIKTLEENNDQKKLAGLYKNLEKLESRFSENEKELFEVEKKLDNLIKKREDSIHPVWGDLMRVGLEKSRFARQIQEYACLYSMNISNLRFYSPFKRFTSPYDLMPHDL